MTRNQRRLAFVAAALLASAGIYGLWWDRAANASKTLLENWIDARRAAGFEILHSGISTTGFPMRIDLAVSNARVSRGGKHPFSWQGPKKIVAHIGPLGLNTVTLVANGQQQLSYQGKQIALDMEDATASITARADGVESLHLTLGNAQIQGDALGLFRIGSLKFDAARFGDVAPDDLKTPTGTLSFEAQQITLPPEAKPLLGPEIQSAALRLSLYGPFPTSLTAEPLAAWSKAGGTLEIDNLHLDDPPLTLDGDGTLALDRDLMPIAPFGLKAKGAFETVDALVDHGFVEPSNAMVAKLALAVLAKEPPDPNTGLMRLPLTLQGRDLFLGPARLAKLPMPPWVEE